MAFFQATNIISLQTAPRLSTFAIGAGKFPQGISSRPVLRTHPRQLPFIRMAALTGSRHAQPLQKYGHGLHAGCQTCRVWTARAFALLSAAGAAVWRCHLPECHRLGKCAGMECEKYVHRARICPNGSCQWGGCFWQLCAANLWVNDFAQFCHPERSEESRWETRNHRFSNPP